MTALGCPHCKAPLPPAPPGLTRCPRCQGHATIPGPADHARLEKKRRDERTLLLAIGAVFFVVYVGPILLALGYMCFVFVLYAAMMIVAIASSA